MNDVIIWPDMKTAERLPYLDYARVFVAYLVILGHLLPTTDTNIRIYIYSFHMPFFFLVSGMLHKDRGCIAWRKYWKTLIVPFLAFNLLFIILWPLCWKIGIWGTLYKLEGGEGIFSIYMYYFKQFFINLFNDQALPDIPTWFLLTLFWCKILTDCICCHRWTIVVLLCIMAGTLFIVFHYRTCLRIGNALMVMPFFYGGFLYKKVINEWRNVRYGWLWGIILVALNIPLTLLNGRVSTAVIWFGQMTIPLNIIIFYLNAFMSSVGLLFVCMQFPASKTLTVCAKALITILCFQCFFCCVFCHLCDLSNYLKMSLIAVLILLACVLIHKTLERYLPFAVGK